MSNLIESVSVACALSDPLPLRQPAIGLHVGDASHPFDHGLLLAEPLLNYKVRIIAFPNPFGGDGILVVPPAKSAFVCTSQTCGGFHTLVTLNAVEGVLITSTLTAQLLLRPSAKIQGLGIRIKTQRTDTTSPHYGHQ